MIDFVRFVHYLGSCMWIGGAVAALLLMANAERESVDVKVGAYRLLTQVQTLLVGIGALLTLGTGVVWSMSLARDAGGGGGAATMGTWIMLATGAIGGVLVLVVVVPTAVKLGGLAVTTDAGATLPAFEYYRRRLSVVSIIATVLAILSLLTGVMW